MEEQDLSKENEENSPRWDLVRCTSCPSLSLFKDSGNWFRIWLDNKTQVYVCPKCMPKLIDMSKEAKDLNNRVDE